MSATTHRSQNEPTRGAAHATLAIDYDDAREDIRLWWGLLKPGGVLLGDDFQGYLGLPRGPVSGARGRYACAYTDNPLF